MLNASLFAQNFPDIRRVCAQGTGNNIVLSWSPITDGCGKFQKICIYGRTDALQPFSLIDSIKTLATNEYTHFGAKAISTTWNYFIVYKFLCNNDSSSSVILPIDFTQPAVSDIDSVSVDLATGQVIIGWRANAAPDLLAYTVWSSQGTNNIPINTVTTTNYTDGSVNSNAGSFGYTLTALDSCRNQSVINAIHQTMFLQKSYDSCKNTISIRWNAYVGWANVLGYDVYAKKGSSGPFALLTSTTSSQLNYTYSNFVPGETVEFYIKAREGTNGFTSTSNKIRVLTRARKFSKRNYFSYASVIDSSTIELKLLADTNADTRKILVYRKKNDEGYIKITELNYNQKETFLTYKDENTTPYISNYQYRFITTDHCNAFLDTSNIAKTILLKVEATENGRNLNWSKYTFWNASVNNYTVYRGFDVGNGFTWNTVSIQTNSDTTFSDVEQNTDNGISGTCYYIVAEENNGNLFGEQAKSKSNTVCLVEDMVIHFPNAFAPEKVNTLFLPKGVNINYKRTNMLIYGRNGQLIRKIEDIREGWDGRDMSGNMCLEGVYLYICELFGLNEKKYNFKGTVHLLR